MRMTIAHRINDLIKTYKHEIIEQYDLFEPPEINDWFYYEYEFTLNVCEDYEDENNVSIVAYGVDYEDDFDSTDWDHVLYRQRITKEELLKL